MLEDRLRIPRYSRLAEHLREQMSRGELRPGDRVPSVPELRGHFEVSRSTVEKAHALLEQEGLIIRRPGHGTFVASPQPREPNGFIGIVAGGIFSPTYRQNFFSEGLMEGMMSFLDPAGKRAVLLTGDSAAGWDKVDGVLICVPDSVHWALSMMAPGVPGVSLLAGAEGVSSVTFNDFDAARQVVEYLVSLGHRRIACLIDSAPPITSERRRGYLAGLRGAGIEPSPAWLRELRTTVAGNGDRQAAREVLVPWLVNGWREAGFTALLAQNDMAAQGAIETLHEAGIHVPEQVSVVGFDSSAVCDCVSPRITAVEVPYREIAAQAAQLLLRHIDRPPAQPEAIVLPARLDVRESTAPPPVAQNNPHWIVPQIRETTFSTANHSSLLNLIEGR